MTKTVLKLEDVIYQMALLIDKNEEPDMQLYAFFFQHPEIGFAIIDYLNKLDEEKINEGPPLYSAGIFAFDICVAQLQASTEAKNKVAAKSLNQLMSNLAEVIAAHQHSLSFWLPILNAFYEVQVELSQELKDAYYELATEDDEGLDSGKEINHLEAIRELIHELSDLSLFEIAENFFAQSYAMPPEFFADLIIDLYNIEEGQDIALLTLLHPKEEVRNMAIETIDHIIDSILLSSISLTRLQTIKYWYPTSYHERFERWIKIQRKKGVIFQPEPEPINCRIKATEVDGSGSQGVFIHAKKGRANRLGGLLLNFESGLKDTWVTPAIPTSEVKSYYNRAFEESVTLREVDFDYFQIIVEHFIAISIENGETPNLQFLELQELLGLRLRAHKLDLEQQFNELSVQISPFTQEVIAESLKRSKGWLKTKQFTESWYIENPVIDKIVNHNSSFVDGVKVCRIEEAMESVFTEEMELNRDRWEFHFLWVALWAKSKHRPNEKIWKDSFLIAHTIRQGSPLKDIPVMKEICYQTVINSVETMQERRTHLSQE
jgi:hypothetical protein